MFSDRPPPQFDRPLHHPAPPSREQRPNQNLRSGRKHPSPRSGAVPFNRVQLAAALIEYNDRPNHDEASGIIWEVQEISHPPATATKQAPHSAIFIPFRQTLPSKPLDFFSGLELASSPKSYPQSMSGFGLVSESGIPKLPETVTVERKRLSENVVVENSDRGGSRSLAVDNELEVLSEWGLDKVLSGHLIDAGPAPEHPPRDNTQPNSSRPPKILPERQRVQSDMFDFRFSELRLDQNQDKALGRSGTTRDFLAGTAKREDLEPVIDDEALLRQRVGCDPEGRKFLRPQSVMELKETQLLYRNPRARLASTSKTKQIALARGRAPTLTSQRAALGDRSKDSFKRKSALRAKSLSPARLVVPASSTPNTISNRTRQRSASGILQSTSDFLTAPPPVRTRRKSALDEPSTHRLHLKPLGVSRSPSRPISPKSHAPTLNPDPKPKRRTSADIVERYQKSIALLEGRKSEDMAYDVPNQPGSSVDESQQEVEATNRDVDSIMLTRAGSPSHSQSEFSIGAPRQFTSRFDPKVASVLSQATPTGMSQPDDLDDDARSFEGEGEAGDQANLQEENLKPIYDEHGRIRFPASLKPMVLIMPVPLTPAQPDPEEAVDDNVNIEDHEEIDPLEKAKQEQLLKLKQVKPAGKLYGRSLMDELNSRTATQKSRQMTFGANRRTQTFLSPEDASRPGSIYSAVDAVPAMQLRAPNNANSRLHLANQAVRTTQYKFNQALVNSSKARQSVFGMDMVMKAELEKLKKIKAIEEEELREEEIKIEAKEAKKQAKKWGKKKITPAVEPNKIEQVKDQINNRMDNWDAMLEKEKKPSDAESRYSAAMEARTTRYFTPLPVLPVPISSNQNLVGNMDDWFKDKVTGSSGNQTPMMNSSLGHENDNEFGNEDTLARKLELQVENMKYKPLPNVFKSHQTVRPDSIHSQAAFMSIGPSSNTQNMMMASPRTLAIDEHTEQEEILNEISEQDRQRFFDHQSHEQDGDSVPLSQRRNLNFPKFNLEVEDDDNRPLSMIGNKRVPTSVRLPIRSPPSNHDSDEELPLGIRASILISQKHPPIDLTNDAESSYGPIGSDASDESDMAPLGLRNTILQPFPSQTFNPSPYSNIQQSPAYAPGGSLVGQAYDLAGARSVRSIGGQSDDIPLGTMLRQPASAFAPTFSFPNLSPAFNNPFQAHFNSAPKDPSNSSDDEDDNVPIGRRITLAPPPPASKMRLDDGNDKQSDKEMDKTEVMTGVKSNASTQNEEETTEISLNPQRRREPIKLRSPIASQVIVDESVAREDTLAALEGRGNVEHADDDVPLGVTRAAHSVTANGTLQRERTMKRKMERQRKQEVNKAKAERELLKAPKDGAVQPEYLNNVDNQSDGDDDDDVPLGMSHQQNLNIAPPGGKAQDDLDSDDLPLGIHHQSMLNSSFESQMIQRQLFHQQQYQLVNPIYPNGFFHHQQPSPAAFPPSQSPFVPTHHQILPLPLDQSDSNVSKWREDIL